MAYYALEIIIAGILTGGFLVIVELWKLGKLKGPMAALNNRFSQDPNTETRRILKQNGARRNILLPNSYQPYVLDPEVGVATRKFGTDDPIRIFKYWGPSGTLETVEVHDYEWQPEKTSEYLSGEVNTIRLLTQGGQTADQLRLGEMREDLKIAATALKNYEKRLGIKAQDSITRSMFSIMKKRAEETAGSMRAAGRPRTPDGSGQDDGQGSAGDMEEGDNEHNQ